MKNLLALFGLAAISAMAADVTGYIIDKNCAGKKEMLGNEACAKRCMADGAPAMLATEDGKVYAIANQDMVRETGPRQGKKPQAISILVGRKVKVTGKVEGDSITIESIKAM